jgi:hypothetical protein
MTTRIQSGILAFLFVLAAAGAAQAQRERTIFNSYSLSGIWGGSKHQVAQFGNNSQSYINGGFIGLEFGKALFVGFSHQSIENTKWDQLQNQNFDLDWRGATVGYGFGKHKAIHPIVNVDFGRGKARLNNSVDRVWVVQPAAGIEINVFRWLHLGLEGGYRFVNDSTLEGLDDTQLSGAFGQASLRFGWSWGKSRNYHKNKKPAADND